MKNYVAPTMELFELRPEEKAIADCPKYRHSHPFKLIFMGQVITCPRYHPYGKGKS